MKNKLTIKFIGVLSVVICLSMVSCKKTFDIAPKNVITYEQMYRNIYDADAAVLGIYGKFLNILDRYVILNELRADMADVTDNADQFLIQLNTHTVTEDNPWADPRPFYEVIMACNDALKNFNIMIAEHKIDQDQYNQRYSDIMALRCWLYFQMGIQYGTVPYVTDPIENLAQLEESIYPWLSFDELLDELITEMESLPYKLPYPVGSTLRTTIDTYSTEKIFINKNCLLGDLYLWRGDYTSAATAYREVHRIGLIPYAVPPVGEQYYEYYMMAYTANINGGNWINIFSQAFGERYTNYEIIWNIPYDKNFNPKNPFIDLIKTSGKYMIKPSDYAINLWNAQYRNDNGLLPGTPGDRRGNGTSYKMVNGQPEINKFTYNYNPLLPFETNSKIILYRGATMFLKFAEAANHDGRHRIASALLNNGIRDNWDPSPGAGQLRDVTNIQQTRDEETLVLETAPYYFDARMGDYPQFRNGWYRNVGVRTRVSTMNALVDSALYFNMTVRPRLITDEPGLTLVLEDLLIREGALELAFEGNRWSDLLRIALRRQATDPNYLANKIGAKFDASGSPEAAAVRARLADPANWYLPFKLK
jgi:starch-binding outer membrane protein, SusD/RagB family